MVWIQSEKREEILDNIADAAGPGGSAGGISRATPGRGRLVAGRSSRVFRGRPRFPGPRRRKAC